MAGTGFVEVGPEIYVLRYPVLDVNTTLIVGGEIAAVVDTLSTPTQATELLTAVRGVTALPLVVINTHHHFDHTFGNAVIADASPGCTIWAHEAAAAELREHGPRWQRTWYEQWLPGEPELAEGIAATTIRAPDRTVQSESTMDIGERVLHLRHAGRGHTDGDLMIEIPDAGVVLAGDLVEQGAPPSFEDSYPVDWPETLADLLHRAGPGTAVVPGHGAVVDLAFVRAQHQVLTALAWLIRDGHGDGAPVEAVAAKATYPPEVALVAVKRGYAELAGRS
ncbi:MAG TPA: MBL fold metallo-hydrolase [Micromonosporaceae bacterium]